MRYNSPDEFLSAAAHRNPGQSEYLQAVTEVVESVWPYVQSHPRYAEHGLLDRLIEPEQTLVFRVCWVDDDGGVRVNRGYRVQHSQALGPCKGGLRFAPSVDLSILKFLAFEQTFKNALTTLPMGSAKGGADFDPKGRSEGEVMRFCQAFATGLYRHVGPDTDVPAGDIGVGEREIGYLAGMVRRLTHRAECVFTGKPRALGGSLIRPEATGYGVVYFAQEVLQHAGRSLEGLRVAVSGAGNVALHAIEKAMEVGARVVTASDTGGTVVDDDGFTPEKLRELKKIKGQSGGRLCDYAERVGVSFERGARPWGVPVDVALPCATQNEIDADAAQCLVKNGAVCVVEGANMPCTGKAIDRFEESGVLYAPGKASNAGGVATSGLEMSQNAIGLSWSAEEVDARLKDIMCSIHRSCREHGQREDGSFSYVAGANIAGFVRVADAMLAEGVI